MSRFYPSLFRSGEIRLMSIHNFEFCYFPDSLFDVIPCQPKYSFELSQLLWIESLWFTSLCKPVLLFYVNLDLFSLWILCQYRHRYVLTSGDSKLTLLILCQLVWTESLWLFSVFLFCMFSFVFLQNCGKLQASKVRLFNLQRILYDCSRSGTI